jgi:hypothetical protein
MAAKTKFRLGQEVFYMDGNRVKSGIVGCIEIKMAMTSGRPDERGEMEQRNSYGLLTGWSVPSSASFCESRLFPSKKDLLKTL